MKIKRFEASSMSEALRQIKKEFGDEAVILSAKSSKKGKRFLGKKAPAQVVVTAAIDKKSEALSSVVDDLKSESNATEEPEKGVGDGGAFFNRSKILKGFNPITKTGQKLIKPKIVKVMNTPKPEKATSSLYRRLTDTGLRKDIASAWEEQIQDLLPDGQIKDNDIVMALAQAIEVKGMVGTKQQGNPSGSKCMVIVGPSGVGKTSTVAKLAAKQAMEHPNSVGILSLDNQRAAGSAELERFAPIIGVPFETVHKPDQMISVLSRWQSLSHIIVDTPAVSLDDPLQREKLLRLIDVLDNPENLLLINASIQEKTMARMIQYFKPIHIHGLVFTCLDWCVGFGAAVNQADEHNLPIGYISDSAQIPEGLQIATADRLAQKLLGVKEVDAQISDETITVVSKSKMTDDGYYVANRNSDIFHFHECKSVKRINTANMIVFKDSAEALGQQFKPCRMCCSDLIVPQPFDRLARGYAGNRY